MAKKQKDSFILYMNWEDSFNLLSEGEKAQFITNLFLFHKGEEVVLNSVVSYAPQMGIRYEVSPLPQIYLSETGTVKFGETELELIFSPGHSPAHPCFLNKEDNFLIGGDVLFYRSIGRTDLPGGNHDLLISNIREKLFSLPDETRVYPGHGPATSIGLEKQFNPFLS